MQSATLDLEKDAMGEAYEDLKKMVFRLCHKFSAKYGFEFEEVLSHAHFFFVKAWNNHDASRASLSTWVYFRIWNDLTRALMYEYRHKDHLEIKEELLTDFKPADTFLTEFLDELSEDAKAVVLVIVKAPDEFSLLCRFNDTKTPKKMLKTLIEHLEDRGWEKDRINSTIDEIKTLVSNFR